MDDFIHSNIFSTNGYLIGISMNFLNVHVNRAPISGKVSLLKHIKGGFSSLRKKEALLSNERYLWIIVNGDKKTGIVQIASRLVRRIVPFIEEDCNVTRGDRIGIIRFGSQVDLIIPDIPPVSLQVKTGELLRAGESIIAKYEK